MRIPEIIMPQSNVSFQFKEEKLISLSEYFGDRIIVYPSYYHQQIDFAINDCLLRESVVYKMEIALKMIEPHYTFKVYDAWRPISVQEKLFEDFFQKLKNKMRDKPISKVIEEAKKFVSLPSYDLNNPSVHNSGGAVDLTIVKRDSGEELDMGTKFDDFSEKAYTTYFEDKTYSVVRDNRRLLYWTMINAGFTNLPSEWWHYDYGDVFWSFYTGEQSIYRGIM